jgi:hypothetical protein
MRRLPVDISTFHELKTSNYVYVDKTEYMYNMITGGRRFFLSRPRRFGKSLLVSTLKEILIANKVLFDDLWIGSSDYHWKEHGVIALDFSTLAANTVELFRESLQRELRTIAHKYQITIDPTLVEPNFILKDLVSALYERFGRVAILVDEYDSSILKTLHNEELAKSIRNIVQQFFTTIKGLDAEVQFVFITGVSSFVKAGIFSGINNLQVLTLNKQFAGICGYSDQEIDHYFSEHIRNWADQENASYDELRKRIKSWYNGYHFGKNVLAVYNPFSFMNALHVQEFKNFWFQSGTPTFLIELLKKKQFIPFDETELAASEDFLGMFDAGTIPVILSMLQEGYLTISGYDTESNLYTLNYPNLEVRTSLQI